MDFTLDDEQQAIAELADKILGEQCPPDIIRTLEAAPTVAERFAADAWAALADADLLGLALPAEEGGSGRGVLDAALVAQQVGRHVALVPYWTSAAAGLTLAAAGSAEQRRRWLPGVVSGAAPLAVALWESPQLGSPERPAVVATPDGDGWRLTGTKSPVPWASQAAALLVPVRVGDDAGRAVAVVDTGLAGLELVDEQVITREPTQTVAFDGVRLGPEGILGSGPSAGTDVVAQLTVRTTALLAATALGLCEGALALTARHAKEREQFGSPIGTFQAVAHRCADAYVDTEAIRLTTWQAIWQLDEGLDAADALAVACFWATEGGQRVVHAAQHLHGGIGVDTDYPVHRYFRWAKVVEALLGGTHAALLRLGASLAAPAGSSTRP